ncbi:MAG: carboxyl transferase domain-containing protein, partial [Lutimonas sp.]
MNPKEKKNHSSNIKKVAELRQKLEEVSQGGGLKKQAKLREKGKMPARERIEYLLDNNSQSIEIGAFAGDEMYAEYGGCPSGGVIVKIGYISGRLCVVVANDPTVKAGAW